MNERSGITGNNILIVFNEQKNRFHRIKRIIQGFEFINKSINPLLISPAASCYILSFFFFLTAKNITMNSVIVITG